MNLDPKLVATVLSAALTRAVLALGLNVDDPLIGSAISLAVGAVVGYLVPNEGTVLRTVQEDGNATLPPYQSTDDQFEASK